VGVVQVIDNLGNPRSQTACSQIASLPDFVSLCLNSHQFVCIFNTYVTPTKLRRGGGGFAAGGVAE